MPHAIPTLESKMEAKPVGSYPDTKIDVLIIGTGLGGLTAALECKRKGHNVTVFERNATINTAGDMYFMGLSATRFFKHWPDMAKRYYEISLHNCWIETFQHNGNRMFAPALARERLRAQGAPEGSPPPGIFQMRPLVYKMFVDEVEKQGIPIHYNHRVVDYFEDESRQKGGVITADGKRHEADVVIAADGVGSKSQALVGGVVRAKASGRAMWRAAFPYKIVEEHPELKKFWSVMQPGDQPIVRTFLGPGTYALTLSRKDVMVWIINHATTGSEEENWNHTISKEEVLKGLDEMPYMENDKWAPELIELVKNTPDNTIVNFDLLWRDPQPQWVSPKGRVVQIGDAAHSYLPSSSSGATQAIEDAISIASCLQIGGKANITTATRVHVRLRFIRNSCAQKLGFSNAELLQSTDWNKVRIEPRLAQPKLPSWIFSHDPEAHAYDYYETAAEGLKKGLAIQKDDIPPNYPPGYKYEPWSIDKIIEDASKGIALDLGEGDWS
ncbi:FAD/NAD(P)-binding domain-containing protein [Sporormia fimetaria CBS 119925]|uniref:FAD/NAD(P)-binding domain-containing protein n=1 Tax=Sporormia fimetaria CBS 119925 TaxID=1340428 RepID=A0A6A6V7A0_9PLEO|nr:FAD/NAD(P)-binding domain-containing protein [Sporormia fimetaria CBS 119925]